MKQIIFAATLAGALFLGNIADAQPRGKQNHRKKSQQERIRDGVRKGSITRDEAMRLQMQQAKLRGYRQMARVDGRVNGNERKLLRGEMRHADHNIARAKHNGHFRKGKGAYANKVGGYHGRDGFRGGNNNYRKGGGEMAFKGQGSHYGRGYQGQRDFRKAQGSDSYKGKQYNNSNKKGRATWDLDDDSRSGSWKLD